MLSPLFVRYHGIADLCLALAPEFISPVISLVPQLPAHHGLQERTK